MPSTTGSTSSETGSAGSPVTRLHPATGRPEHPVHIPGWRIRLFASPGREHRYQARFTSLRGTQTETDFGDPHEPCFLEYHSSPFGTTSCLKQRAMRLRKSRLWEERKAECLRNPFGRSTLEVWLLWNRTSLSHALAEYCAYYGFVAE